MGLFKNLTATALASITGMAMQALTAPLYLMAFNIHDFSTWLFVTSLGAYLSLTVNGLFYSLMNDITIERHSSHTQKAQSIYQDAAYIVLYIFLPLAVVAVASYFTLGRSIVPLIMISLATCAINLSYVLIDANFRSMSIFAKGSNILSVSRVLDWIVGLSAANLTKSVGATLLIVLAYRTFATVGFILAFQGSREALKLTVQQRAPGLATVAGHIAKARGQLAIAATSASSSMAPQIVASSVFPGHLSVYFNIYRTYMRLLASATTTATAAAWPILNRMYAEQRREELRRFFGIGIVAVAVLAAIGAAILIAIAGFAFPILFRSKIEIIHSQLAIIGLGVAISTMTIFCQSMFVSTNMKSRSIYLNLAITLFAMSALYVASRTFGIYALLWGLVASELVTFIAALTSAVKSLNKWQQKSMVPQV